MFDGKRCRRCNTPLQFADDFAALGPWASKLAALGMEIAAPTYPVKLIRTDANGRLETLETMHAGSTTGLQLPFSLNAIDEFVEAIIGSSFGSVDVAA